MNQFIKMSHAYKRKKSKENLYFSSKTNAIAYLFSCEIEI